MNAKAKVRVNGNHKVAGHVHRAHPRRGIEVATLNAMNDAKIHEAPANRFALLKAIGMAFAAPLIGLAYAIALPAVGLYLLAKLAFEAWANRAPAASAKMKRAMVMAKNIGLFLAAPFIALGYIVALPAVGCFMIAKLALEAHGKRVHAAS